MSDAHYIQVRGARTDYEVADVFREYGDAYRAAYRVTPEQARVMGAIVACRTEALGGQIYECQVCGAVEFAYCSCRDRHCPKCQKFARAQWVEGQKVYLLPIPYFHVVFTTDHALNAWVSANRAAIYNVLFETAAAVLKQFAALELRGELGITAVLHTWGQTLLQHLHLHCIVTGGALSFDGQRWVRCAPNYLFDIVAVSAAFRDAFCAGWVRLARKEHPLEYVPFAPELVGQKPVNIVLGKNSGPPSIDEWCEKLGVSATEEQRLAMLQQVKAKSFEKKDLLTPEEFQAIVDRVLQEVPVA